jgi:hypothetical protein
LYFGEQSAATARRAREWLRRRATLSTDFLFNILADRLYPRIPVDKSPTTVHVSSLQRVKQQFPEARFLHLVRHPRGQLESAFKLLREREKRGQPVPEVHWLKRITADPPGRHWYEANATITSFLESIPPDRQLRIRGEDLLSDPDAVLPTIAAWMRVRTDADAIDEMKHPERSPFASVGPPGARWGNDVFFLRSPALRPVQTVRYDLNEALPGRTDGRRFAPRIQSLARRLGYA